MSNTFSLFLSIFCIIMNLLTSSNPQNEPEPQEPFVPVLSEEQQAERVYRARLERECGELFSRYPDEDGWLEEYFGTDIPFLADADYIDSAVKTGFSVGNARELASFCWYVNTQNIGDVDLTITADIDLSIYEWAPTGWSGGVDINHPYTGIVNGGGHTIKGMTMDTDGYYGGFLGWCVGAGVYDLAFEDASVRCWCTGAVCAAEAIGGRYENVEVRNSTVDCAVNAGSLLGWDANATKVGCSADVRVNGGEFPYLSFNDSEKARISIDEPFVISMDESHVVTRTGGRNDYVNLCWNIYRDGAEFRYEGASGSTEYDCGFIFEYNHEGKYEVFLTAFVEGQYVPVSNTIVFTVDG